MKSFQKIITGLFFLAGSGTALSQQPATATAAGGHFSESKGRQFWMGSNYRKEWNTPITVSVFSLAKEHGGLTPIKRGGGKQTKSLRLADAQGREYTLRSIAKFITSKTLPGDLQSEAAADLVSDGVSASYPYAALSIPVLASAAGIPHGNAKVVYIPDDPALGEFRKDFGNMLALYEERLPDSVDKAYGSEEVVEKLENDNDNEVDQYALLKIRILDMFIMDFDRHEGQWTWGAWDNGKGKVFFPLAKDRDQAFYINRGVLPGIIKSRTIVPQLEGFKAKAHDITRFNFAARNFDRFFLNQLPEADWRKAAEQFVASMTDAVIDQALDQQPAEIKAISAKKIADILKARRANLVEEVMTYYRFLAGTVSVSGSDKKEKYDCTIEPDGSVQLDVYKLNKEGVQQQKMYGRHFSADLTREIRIYGFDGDDQFALHGEGTKIRIRLIGGGGKDEFVNTSKSAKPYLYDKESAKNTVTGRFRNRMSDDSTVNSFNWIYYKYPFRSVFGNFGYNRDDGVFLGPTLKIVHQGFRKVPYKTLHQIKALYAFSTGAFFARYRGEFISVLGSNTDITADAEYRGPNATNNFFGYGNNSVYDVSQQDKFKYYRIRYKMGDISLHIRQRFSNQISLEIGPSYTWYSMDSSDHLNAKRNVVLNPLSGLNPSVYRDQSYYGARVNFVVDTRNSEAMPDKGVNWITGIRHYAGIGSNSYKSVTQLNTDFAFYANLIPDRLVWANRTGAGVTLGEGGFEFFQAQYLGSDDNLRGYRKQRFAGKAKFYNQTELRLRLANLKTYLFPASFGIVAFLDAGRVWVKNDVANGFKAGWGGGVWFAPLKKIVISVSFSRSEEENMPLLGIGYKF